MKVILASASPRRQELLKQIIGDFEIVVPNVDEEALVHPDPQETAKRTARAKAEAVAELHPQALIIAGDTVVAIDGQQLAKPKDEPDAHRMLRRLSGRTHIVVTGICLIAPYPCGEDVRASTEGEGVGGEGRLPTSPAVATSPAAAGEVGERSEPGGGFPPTSPAQATPPNSRQSSVESVVSRIEFQTTTQVTFHPLTDAQIAAYIATGEPMDKAGAYGAQGEAAKMIAKIDGSLTNVIGLPLEDLKTALEPILSKSKCVTRNASRVMRHDCRRTNQTPQKRNHRDHQRS